eukprot:CAMPEP_0119365840 /NCGR_PEP_ID=MMETSP1334-20130426/12745_1 /TAXON_ID=127549 /ORGANISM="Calcidiscus leptoporus, Strain RCC1130" /LENGTH=32 /DNA_ID= /DNA_START= /DNA_END= /DNA_ORIENTATION=
MALTAEATGHGSIAEESWKRPGGLVEVSTAGC